MSQVKLTLSVGLSTSLVTFSGHDKGVDVVVTGPVVVLVVIETEVVLGVVLRAEIYILTYFTNETRQNP